MRRHERLVLVTALRLLGKMEDAQDASQEVFLRLYRNLGKVRASDNLPGWLYRVTVNVCHDVRRRRPDETWLRKPPNWCREAPIRSRRLPGGKNSARWNSASGCFPAKSVRR